MTQSAKSCYFPPFHRIQTCLVFLSAAPFSKVSRLETHEAKRRMYQRFNPASEAAEDTKAARSIHIPLDCRVNVSHHRLKLLHFCRSLTGSRNEQFASSASKSSQNDYVVTYPNSRGISRHANIVPQLTPRDAPPEMLIVSHPDTVHFSSLITALSTSCRSIRQNIVWVFANQLPDLPDNTTQGLASWTVWKALHKTLTKVARHTYPWV